MEGKQKFLEIVEKYNVCSKELLKFLDESGFYKAPASTMSNLHNAFDGGLVDHLIKVTRHCITVNESNGKLDPKLRCEPSSVARVALLHGIGRANLYKPNPSEWHRKNLGKMYEFNENLVSLTVAERSIYYINTYGGDMTLTEEEYQAIINSEKDLSNDNAVKWHSKPLAVLLRQQIEWAIMSEQTPKN